MAEVVVAVVRVAVAWLGSQAIPRTHWGTESGEVVGVKKSGIFPEHTEDPMYLRFPRECGLLAKR